jgi:hypothetical protein
MIAIAFVSAGEHCVRTLVQRWCNRRRFRRELRRLQSERHALSERYWGCKEPVAKQQLREQVDAKDLEIFMLRLNYEKQFQPKR